MLAALAATLVVGGGSPLGFHSRGELNSAIGLYYGNNTTVANKAKSDYGDVSTVNTSEVEDF